MIIHVDGIEKIFGHTENQVSSVKGIWHVVWMVANSNYIQYFSKMYFSLHTDNFSAMFKRGFCGFLLA